MQHFIYIVECADKTLYTGYTTDLKRRIDEHNYSLKGAKYTKGRRPIKLQYSECFEKKGDALRRECEIKRLSREKKLILIG